MYALYGVAFVGGYCCEKITILLPPSPLPYLFTSHPDPSSGLALEVYTMHYATAGVLSSRGLSTLRYQMLAKHTLCMWCRVLCVEAHGACVWVDLVRNEDEIYSAERGEAVAPLFFFCCSPFAICCFPFPFPP